MDLFVFCLSNSNFPDLNGDPVLAHLIANDCARSAVNACEEDVLFHNVEIFWKFFRWISIKSLTLLLEILFVDTENKLRLVTLDVEEQELVSWSFESLGRKNFAVVSIHEEHGVLEDGDSLGLRRLRSSVIGLSKQQLLWGSVEEIGSPEDGAIIA